MKTAITLSLLLIAVGLCAAYNNPVCNTTEVCQTSAGTTCAYTTTVDNECDYGLYCNTTSFMCSTRYSLGSACVMGGDQCGEGLICAYDANGNTVCTSQFAGPGESCTTNADCVYLNFDFTTGVISMNSTCVSGKCYGMPQAGNCFTAYQCNSGLYCNATGLTGTCIPQVAVGQMCDRTQYFPCSGMNNDCEYTDSTKSASRCTAPMSATSGQFCTSTYYCADGLFCGSDNTCHSGKSSMTACTMDSDCTASYETCQCASGKNSAACQLPYATDASDINLQLAYLGCLKSNAVSCHNNQVCSQCTSALCSLYKHELADDPTIANSNLCGASSAAKSAIKSCTASSGKSSSSSGAIVRPMMAVVMGAVAALAL